MRITSWNYLHGQSLDPTSTTTLSEVAASLGSDLIALQEIDMNLERSGRSNQSREFAHAIGSASWGFAPAIHGTPGFNWRTLTASERRVITEDDESANEYYGIAIASKIPVTKWLRLELGKSLIGMPLLIANEKGKVAPFYVKDEPRVALAAVLDNGWTVINTHLSFVPLVNIYQLLKLTRWAAKVERQYSTKVILVGDLNLPWGIPVRVSKWLRATVALTYPSWKPAISFDYILMSARDIDKAAEVIAPRMPISDHRPISVDIA